MSRKVVLITEIIAPYRIPVLHQHSQKSGIDLHVIFLSENDRTLREWQVYRDELRFSYEVLASRRCRVGRYNWLLNSGMAKALLGAFPDVIVCGGYNYVAAWQAALWSRRRGVPFLLWVESTASDSRRNYPWVEFLKARFIKRCAGFVAAGESSREYLLSFGIASRSVFTAPNAVDVDLFARRSNEIRQHAEASRALWRLPSRYILSVGRLVREKGVFDLLQAYAALPVTIRSEVGLVFVGSGREEAELRRRAARINPGEVQFRGFCQREHLPQFYALAEVFVLATHSDTWGLVVNEAMSCGVPVICTSVAGCARDLLRDGWNGRVVSSQDPVALTGALGQVCAGPDLRELMGQRSAQRISAYSPQACAEGIARAALASLEPQVA